MSSLRMWETSRWLSMSGRMSQYTWQGFRRVGATHAFLFWESKHWFLWRSDRRSKTVHLFSGVYCVFWAVCWDWFTLPGSTLCEALGPMCTMKWSSSLSRHMPGSIIVRTLCVWVRLAFLCLNSLRLDLFTTPLQRLSYSLQHLLLVPVIIVSIVVCFRSAEREKGNYVVKYPCCV